MRIDGVFSGGGVKAYAFIGVMKRIEEEGLAFERVAGTSAGAIIASLLAARYSYHDIRTLMEELNLKNLLDPPVITKWLPFTKWLFLYFQLGINKGNKLEGWIGEKLAVKHIYTFKDIHPDYLKVIASDISLGKLVVIPDDLERIYGIPPEHFPVATAIRMSAGFPYFFMPKKLSGKNKTKSLMVDGGLLSNFPLWVFGEDHNKRKRPVLGVKLSAASVHLKPRKIKTALAMFHALFLTMIEAHDSRYVSMSQANNIIFIPVENLESTDFNIDNDIKKKLIQAGYEQTSRFLRSWPR
ncbi:patatin-like phospholipase family protein [Virgibacillus proomii]|jgi:NTE family protein|uniref:patatin-like phospholipase family protein n=1 Tax=Virgibacillus proomii TaxID=84407 RepID=UPI000985B9BD|nr:patatin-like phospholipase family protein [Virgibacillus proomii]